MWRVRTCCKHHAGVVMAVTLFCFASSSSASTKKFMVGPYQGLDGTGAVLDHQLSLWIDTLKSSWAWEDLGSSARATKFMSRGFKLYASDSSDLVGHRGYQSRERFLVWQTDSLSLPPWFPSWRWDRGRRVLDQGDTVWSVSASLGDTRGNVLTGPWAYERSRVDQDRQAIFKLRIENVPPTDTAVLIRVQHFAGGSADDSSKYIDEASLAILGSTAGYQSITLNWTDAIDVGRFICYPVYWYGKGNLYVDEITSKSVEGEQILAGQRDLDIKKAVAPLTFGSGDSVVHIWKTIDEGVHLENFLVAGRIDSVLSDTTGHARGASIAPYPQWPYIKMARPRYLIDDIYPYLGGTAFSGEPQQATSHRSDYVGSDSLSLQARLTTATSNLRRLRFLCDTTGSPGLPVELIINTQTFKYVKNCNEGYRYPTGPEAACCATLCLAYGVDGLIYWKGITWPAGGDSCNTGAGLIDGNGQRTPIFNHLAVTFAPFIDSLGDRFYDFEWLGADSSEVVASIPGSFVDSIRSLTFPARPYVEAAFFRDTVAQTDHLMLVNRRCLTSESQSVRSWLDKTSGMYYVIDMYSYDTVLTGSLTSGAIPFTTTLSPGEGKLFKIVPVGTSTVSGSTLPQKWQGGIAIGGNVTVDSSRTLAILAPADIKVNGGSGYTLNVYGSMTAVGTATDAIQFRHNSSSPYPTAWNGVKQMGPGSLTWRYVQLRDAYKGLWLADTTHNNTMSITHCDFRQNWIAGVYVENDTASAISIDSSHFEDMQYGCVTIYKGKADVKNSRFVGAYSSGVQLDGYTSRKTGGLIKGNSFDSMETDNAYGVWLNTVSNDTRDAANGENLLEANSFGPTWLGSTGQAAVYVNNCSDWPRIYLLSTQNNTSGYIPTYGILTFSTRTQIRGDHAVAESLSAIQGPRYGVYCASTSGSDPDFALVRNVSISAGHAEAIPGYGIYVYSNSRVDAGSQAEPGGNAFYGFSCSGCPGCVSMDAGSSTLYNKTRAMSTLPEGITGETSSAAIARPTRIGRTRSVQWIRSASWARTHLRAHWVSSSSSKTSPPMQGGRTKSRLS